MMAAQGGKSTRGTKGRASFAKRKVRVSWRNRLAQVRATLKVAVEGTSMTEAAALAELSKVYGEMRAAWFQGRRKWRG